MDKKPLVKELLLPNEVKSESKFYVKTENCDSAGDENTYDISSNSDSEFSEQDDGSYSDGNYETMERPFKCTYCNKGFTSPAYVDVHERIHSGKKPYKCSECGKCFTQLSNLLTHRKIHSSDRPHKCPECGKSFKRSHDVKQHSRRRRWRKAF